MNEQNPIVILTDTAIAHVKKMLIKDPQAIGLRVGIKKRGCSGYAYVLEIIKEQPKIAHQTLQQNEVAIFIDNEAIPFIKHSRLDFINKGFGHEEWTFNNPNAESLCGCGESFNLKEQTE